MNEAPFVPEVTDSLDTSYFVDSARDDKDLPASMKASITRSAGLNPSLGGCSVDGNESEGESEGDDAFAGFDYSNIFSLKEMNNEQLGFAVRPETERAGDVSPVGEAEAEGTWDENVDEEWEISSSSGNSLMNHCSLRVEESGDYVNYTFNFQGSDDCSVCWMLHLIVSFLSRAHFPLDCFPAFILKMPTPLQLLNQRRMRNKLDSHASAFDPIGRGSRSKSKRRQASPCQLPARRTLMQLNEAKHKYQWIHKRIRFALSCLRESVEY